MSAFKEILSEYDIELVYANRDYDTYSKSRDLIVKKYLRSKNVQFKDF